MIGCYKGKTLSSIDLTKGTKKVEIFSEEMLKKYIGWSGLAAKVLNKKQLKRLIL